MAVLHGLVEAEGSLALAPLLQEVVRLLIPSRPRVVPCSTVCPL